MKVIALPKNVTFKEQTQHFVATYKQEGQKILINRKLVREREKEYCDPVMWGESVRLHEVIARDARAQVLIQ